MRFDDEGFFVDGWVFFVWGFLDGCILGFVFCVDMLNYINSSTFSSTFDLSFCSIWDNFSSGELSNELIYWECDFDESD